MDPRATTRPTSPRVAPAVPSLPIGVAVGVHARATATAIGAHSRAAALVGKMTAKVPVGAHSRAAALVGKMTAKVPVGAQSRAVALIGKARTVSRFTTTNLAAIARIARTASNWFTATLRAALETLLSARTPTFAIGPINQPPAMPGLGHAWLSFCAESTGYGSSQLTTGPPRVAALAA